MSEDNPPSSIGIAGTSLSMSWISMNGGIGIGFGGKNGGNLVPRL